MNTVLTIAQFSLGIIGIFACLSILQGSNAAPQDCTVIYLAILASFGHMFFAIRRATKAGR